MAAIILFAGMLLLLYGVATLLGGEVAASRPLRSRSRLYAMLCSVGGAVLILVGGIGLVRAL